MAIVAIAAAIGMVSCSKDGNNGGTDIDGRPMSVSLTLTQKPAPRSVADPITDKEAVTFGSGYVIFTNSLGIINKITEIVPGSYTSGDDAAKATGSKVWLEDMKVPGGGEIKNVPAAATMVYIVGNLPAGKYTPVVSENISVVKNLLISISSQSNSAGSVADVTLYGDGATLTTDGDVKRATVTVDAIASRIEIGKISYNGAGLVEAYQIDGIFINNYYPSMSLASVVSAAIINNTPADNAAADAIYKFGSTDYPAAESGKLYDYDADGLGYDAGSSLIWSTADPSDKKVWAYNVLAPKTFEGIAIAAPHIVIRLSNLVTADDNGDNKVYPGTQYLTVKEFRKVKTTEVIEKFEPGYIYFIKDLTFDESNLTDFPEMGTVTAYVEAKLMSWTRQEVEWGY